VVISHIPSVLRVDPRAHSVAVSPIYIASDNSILVCVTSYQASIDLPSASSDLLVNQTSGNNLLISGNSSSVTAALANLHLNGNVTSSAVAFQMVAVTAPNLNSALCGDANAVRQVSISAFGLQQNLVKVPLSMAKKH
jgi:hypothetical protein